MSTKPRILHLSTVTAPRSGVGAVIHSLTRASRQTGYSVRVVSGYGIQTDADFTAMGQWRYSYNALRSRLWAEDGFLPSSAMRRIVGYIEKQRPDLVHLHNLHGYYCDISVLERCLDRLGVPVVMTLHDLWAVTGRCAYPVDDSCTGHCRRCPHRNLYPAKWMPGRDMSSKKNSFMSRVIAVAPSRWVADRTAVYNPVVIPNGVDGIFQRPSEPFTSPGVDLLAVATRWTPVKGIDDLVRLADELPHGWSLTLAGDNVPSHSRITDAGNIADPAILASMMSRATAVLSAARHEAFGMTVAESLSVGTPVVVRAGTAPAEMCTPDTGRCVDYGDPQAVIGAVRELADRSRPLPLPDIDLSADRMARQYIELYTKAGLRRP